MRRRKCVSVAGGLGRVEIGAWTCWDQEGSWKKGKDHERERKRERERERERKRD